MLQRFRGVGSSSLSWRVHKSSLASFVSCANFANSGLEPWTGGSLDCLCGIFACGSHTWASHCTRVSNFGPHLHSGKMSPLSHPQDAWIDSSAACSHMRFFLSRLCEIHKSDFPVSRKGKGSTLGENCRAFLRKCVCVVVHHCGSNCGCLPVQVPRILGEGIFTQANRGNKTTNLSANLAMAKETHAKWGLIKTSIAWDVHWLDRQ